MAQMVLPSYSTLTVIAVGALLVQLAVNLAVAPLFAWGILAAWAIVIGLLVLYPFLGLALEGAPGWAYAIMLTGPAFILWRTALAFVSRFGGRAVTWVRTPRRREV